MNKSTLTILLLFCSAMCVVYGKSLVKTDSTCYITITKVRTVIPYIPQTEEECRAGVHLSGLYECHDNLYIKRECMCSYWWFNGKNICDTSLDHITCSTCLKFSLNGSGPCLNGGTPDCSMLGKDFTLANDIQCQCPEGFKGRFCEEKEEKMYQVCEFVEPKEKEKVNAKDCSDGSSRPCVTTSKHNQSFVCYNKVITDPHSMYNCEDVPFIKHDVSSETSQQRKKTNIVNSSCHLETLHVLIYMLFLTCLKLS